MELYQKVGAANEPLHHCPHEGCSYKTTNRQIWRQHRHQHKIRETRRFACEECNYISQNNGQGRGGNSVEYSHF